jgi:hypothetical protein
MGGCAIEAHIPPPERAPRCRRAINNEEFVPMHAEISQEVVDRLMMESVGGADLSEDKLVDKSSNLLSLSCVYTSCHHCQRG